MARFLSAVPPRKGPCYKLRFRTELPSVTAFRIEAIPDDRLPQGGAGRYPGEPPGVGRVGNFHIAEVSAAISMGENDLEPKRIPISQALADFHNPNHPITHALDGDPKTFWNTHPQFSEFHNATFAIQIPAGSLQSELIITVDSGLTGWNWHGLGRFRISVTDDAIVTHSFAVEQLSDPREKLAGAVLCDSDARMAAKLLDTVIKVAPDDATRAKVIGQAINDDTILAALVELRPKLSREIAESYAKKGDSKWQNQNDEKALENTSKALDYDPQNARAHCVRGKVWQRQKKIGLAIKAYRKVLEIDPKNPVKHESQSSLAWIYVTNVDSNGMFHHIEEAVQLAEQACKGAPEKPDYWNAYGIASYRAERYQEAVAALQRSFDLGRKCPHNLLYIGMAKWRLGEKGKSLKWYNDALLWRTTQKRCGAQIHL
jgi:tetratricopeptide (TPR) repeat protein